MLTCAHFFADVVTLQADGVQGKGDLFKTDGTRARALGIRLDAHKRDKSDTSTPASPRMPE